jgi:inorganic pyrophosphatase
MGDDSTPDTPLQLDVVIEIPRWSFLKRGSSGRVDFVSPIPCPFNYGSVRAFVGSEGDFLDAIVLGPRLARGARVKVSVYGAIGFTDRDIYDDKLVCSRRPLQRWDRQMVLIYMHAYGWFKRSLNWCRRRRGHTVCEGWTDARRALARAHRCRDEFTVQPSIPF